MFFKVNIFFVNTLIFISKIEYYGKTSNKTNGISN